MAADKLLSTLFPPFSILLSPKSSSGYCHRSDLRTIFFKFNILVIFTISVTMPSPELISKHFSQLGTTNILTVLIMFFIKILECSVPKTSKLSYCLQLMPPLTSLEGGQR